MQHEEIARRVFETPMGCEILNRGTRIISREGWYQLITPGSADPARNEVYWSQIGEEACERVVQETLGTSRALELPVKWCVTPFTKPTGFHKVLEKHSSSQWQCRGMWKDLREIEDPLEFSAQISCIENEDHVNDYVRAYSEGWNGSDQTQIKEDLEWTRENGGERFHFFLASVDGEAAGTAGYILNKKSAYFVGGNVLPRYQGKGIYKALIAARAKHALERGVDFGVTHAREKTSAPILEKQGWGSAYPYSIYLC